ncbi:MAG: DUF2182 domain-containing protein [Betaproteobacteria bacterium]|nr:DUF2182 domain-containing protein [Betaproteobacteria bacterium]MCC7218108.1 DUF2182 domain-containing protein [Burkholderiales bacterium]
MRAGAAPARPHLPLAAAVLALSAAAWIALAAWGASPWARYAVHDGWVRAGALAALCRAVPEGDVVVPAALHALAWVLMIAAMMLPTTWPLLALFRRIVAGRADARRLLAAVVGGFFAAWLAFGVAAHAADALVHWTAARTPALAAWDWAIGAAVLAGAGAFQWSALKYRCLEACRSPFAFVAARWHGRAPVREAWRLGVDHGVFCVGCCWALMLLMFVVGTGSLALMLALAAVMAAEKNLRWGRRLRTPLGVALVVGAAAVVAAHV